ncbi:MAG: PsiF family protein [Hydrogenophaga sp.]|uniref:PsiF family protein n=1 Tax=Hydrogenophaga sp. TaxID=1904254 RepID=UPI003D110CB4
MRKLVLCSFVLAALMPAASFAEGPSCNAAAAEKKLHGAAKTSFLKKCEKDAAATCDMAAAEKKIHGAAKTSFTRKCVKDAVGAAAG